MAGISLLRGLIGCMISWARAFGSKALNASLTVTPALDSGRTVTDRPLSQRLEPQPSLGLVAAVGVSIIFGPGLIQRSPMSRPRYLKVSCHMFKVLKGTHAFDKALYLVYKILQSRCQELHMSRLFTVCRVYTLVLSLGHCAYILTSMA